MVGKWNACSTEKKHDHLHLSDSLPATPIGVVGLSSSSSFCVVVVGLGAENFGNGTPESPPDRACRAGQVQWEAQAGVALSYVPSGRSHSHSRYTAVPVPSFIVLLAEVQDD